MFEREGEPYVCADRGHPAAGGAELRGTRREGLRRRGEVQAQFDSNHQGQQENQKGKETIMG